MLVAEDFAPVLVAEASLGVKVQKRYVATIDSTAPACTGAGCCTVVQCVVLQLKVLIIS